MKSFSDGNETISNDIFYHEFRLYDLLHRIHLNQDKYIVYQLYDVYFGNEGLLKRNKIIYNQIRTQTCKTN